MAVFTSIIASAVFLPARCLPDTVYTDKSITSLTSQRDVRVSHCIKPLQAPGAEARADNLVLHGLAVKLGPDLRVLYPMNVLNFGISGELAANGPAHPSHLKLAGTIRSGTQASGGSLLVLILAEGG